MDFDGGICFQLAFRTNSDKNFTLDGTRVCWVGTRNGLHCAIRVRDHVGDIRVDERTI